MASPTKDSAVPQATRASLHWIILLLACLALFFFKLGSYPLLDVDEPRYAGTAREMIERGNWITPYFNYEVRFDKPVMFYWLIAASYQLFGVSEFSARLVSALAATGLVAMLYAFGRHWLGARYGLFSALIFGTSLLTIGLARMSITDMTLCLFMTGTTLSLFMAARRNVRWWILAGVFSGLAMLTKGPIGLLIPGAVVTVYSLFVRDWKRLFLNAWFPAGVLIALLIAVPWYWLAYQENGPVFLQMLLFHNVTRFSDTVSGHDQPWYFFFIVLPVGFLPWSMYLIPAIRRTVESLKQPCWETESHLHLFMAIWIILTFTLFTLSGTKLLTYILPLFPALALWMGLLWRHWAEENIASKWPARLTWLFFAGLLVAAGLFLTQPRLFLPREAATVQLNSEMVVLVWLTLLAGIAWVAVSLKRLQYVRALYGVTVTFCMFVMMALQGIIPAVSQAAQGDVLNYLAQVGERPLFIYEIQRPSLTFYGQRRIERLTRSDMAEFVSVLAQEENWFVITRNKQVSRLQEILPPDRAIRTLEKGPVYSLLSINTSPPAH